MTSPPAAIGSTGVSASTSTSLTERIIHPNVKHPEWAYINPASLGITHNDFEDTEKSLPPYIKHPEIVKSVFFSTLTKANVYLVLANEGPVKSFKDRGAYIAMEKYAKQAQECGYSKDQVEFAAASEGNHAQGVARAASLLGYPVHIFMPHITPKIKIDRALEFGMESKSKHQYVTITLNQHHLFDYSEKRGQKWVVEINKSPVKKVAYFIHPFDDKFTILGQGTVAIEILKKLPDVTIVSTGLGGGGLAAGIASYFNSISARKIKTIGVQPAGACSLIAAFMNRGVPTPLAEITNDTMHVKHDIRVDGTTIESSGFLTTGIALHCQIDCESVTKEMIAYTMYLYLSQLMKEFGVEEKTLLSATAAELDKLLINSETTKNDNGLGTVLYKTPELSGMLPIANLLKTHYSSNVEFPLEGETICLIQSGGNIEYTKIQSIYKKGKALVEECQDPKSSFCPRKLFSEVTPSWNGSDHDGSFEFNKQFRSTWLRLQIDEASVECHPGDSLPPSEDDDDDPKEPISLFQSKLGL